MSSLLQMFLRKFDCRNKKIIDLQQRANSFSFIHSYLLVVKVGQMFSIMQEKCQAISAAFARNLWGKGLPYYQRAEVPLLVRGSTSRLTGFYGLNLQPSNA